MPVPSLIAVREGGLLFVEVQGLQACGLSCSEHVGSSQTRD